VMNYDESTDSCLGHGVLKQTRLRRAVKRANVCKLATSRDRGLAKGNNVDRRRIPKV
jgi:hypothetical protein